jgi:hypothetical protein
LQRRCTTTEINLHIPALLPNDFCGDVHERLSIYKRLAIAVSQCIDDMQEELIDRFGKLPEQVKSLKPTACGLPPNRWASSKSTPTREAITNSSRSHRSMRCALSSWYKRTSISAEWSGQTAHHRQHA